MKALLLATIALVSVATATAADAGETKVAVAANFTEAVKEIATAFTRTTGHTVVFSFGASGQLYTQITQDAPFEVFLAADDERPRKAADAGLGVPGSVYTYAIGRLVLWSANPALVTGEDTLRTGTFTKIAIANPKTAPYGAAAVQALTRMGLYQTLEPRFVQGTNIAQTYQFIETGNAELGFVAAAQLVGRASGSVWPVPELLHDPIRQDVVLLKKGETNEAARAFHAFLRGPEAARVIEAYGYGTAATN